MFSLHFEKISTDEITFPGSTHSDISISILRLDKIHPVISGNKWFKLKLYIAEALAQNKKTIVTFGGAWSNHVVATAAACKETGLHSIGIIRGEQPPQLSATLATAMSYAMQLFFVSREEYRKKMLPQELLADTNDLFIIDEGGYGSKGAEGAASIAACYAGKSYTHICCACGTGTMMAGLIKAALPGQQVIGISVLKNNYGQEEKIRALLNENEREKQYRIFHSYHFGGYAKYQPELIQYMNEFYRHTFIPSDFVYTGKLLYAINDLIPGNFFPAGSRLLIIHSGGLQGNSSLQEGMLIF